MIINTGLKMKKASTELIITHVTKTLMNGLIFIIPLLTRTQVKKYGQTKRLCGDIQRIDTNIISIMIWFIGEKTGIQKIQLSRDIGIFCALVEVRCRELGGHTILLAILTKLGSGFVR